MQELARIVRTVAEAWPVETWVWPVHLLCSVPLHKQVDRHHTSCLTVTQKERNWRMWNWWNATKYFTFLLGVSGYWVSFTNHCV